MRPYAPVPSLEPTNNSHCKTNYGYGAMANVSDVNGAVEDKQESYFLAETLK